MATFWDEDGTSGWAETAVKAAKPVTAKPSKEQMQTAWNENKGDPAKIYELMQTHGVGVKDVAGILGASQEDVADYLNSGRKATQVRSGAGDNMEVNDVYNYGESHREAQTKDEFMATVEPWMIDAQGKFKRPHDGVNYRWEGMTPDEVFASRQPRAIDPSMARDGTDGSGPADAHRLLGHKSYDAINLKWEPGYDNGGGVLGGMVRAVGNFGTEVAKNPALMAALTAGIGSAMAPAAQAGATAGGTATGGSAGIGSGTVLGGGTASVSPGILQTFAASPYAQPAMNAVKTLASGGDLGDAALSAGGSYLGGQVSDGLGGGDIGRLGGSVVSGMVSGKDPLQVLLSSGANAAAGMITGNVPGFDALSPAQQTAINNTVAQAMRGKNPTKALIDNATKLAMGQIPNSKPKSNTKTGGWAA